MLVQICDVKRPYRSSTEIFRELLHVPQPGERERETGVPANIFDISPCLKEQEVNNACVPLIMQE